MAAAAGATDKAQTKDKTGSAPAATVKKSPASSASKASPSRTGTKNKASDRRADKLKSRLRLHDTGLAVQRTVSKPSVLHSSKVDTRRATDSVALDKLPAVVPAVAKPAVAAKSESPLELLSTELRQLVNARAPKARGRINLSFTIDGRGRAQAPMVIGFDAALDAELEAAIAKRAFPVSLAGMQVQNTLVIRKAGKDQEALAGRPRPEPPCSRGGWSAIARRPRCPLPVIEMSHGALGICDCSPPTHRISDAWRRPMQSSQPVGPGTGFALTRVEPTFGSNRGNDDAASQSTSPWQPPPPSSPWRPAVKMNATSKPTPPGVRPLLIRRNTATLTPGCVKPSPILPMKARAVITVERPMTASLPGWENDWAVCFGSCQGYSETDCLAASGCRAAYIDPCAGAACDDGELQFFECWGVAPSGPVQGGDCDILQADECSRHDDCSAVHEPSTDASVAIGRFNALHR